MSTTQNLPAELPAAGPEDEAAVASEEWAAPAVPFTYRRTTARRLYDRGMATAEYAIGVLAAIAVALTLAKFITGATFLDPFTKKITEYIGKLGTQIKVR